MFRSPYPDVAIPALTLREYLFADIDEATLDEVAIVDGTTGAATDYRTLIGQIDAVAAGLTAAGVGPGDVVALHAPNVPAFASVFHGILRAGATATTVNALYTASDIEHQLRASGATRIFTVSPLMAPAVEGARAAGFADDQIVVLDGADGFASLRDLAIPGGALPDLDLDAAQHLAVLPFSSGTTGRPKGVMLTHRNLVANVEQARPFIDVGDGDVVLAILPFFHIYGMTVLLNLALKVRATLITLPRFDLVQFLQTIQDQKVTYLFIAPPIAVALAKHPLIDQYDLSSVRVVLSGAAPLDEHTAQAVADRLGCEVTQGYGMTEMSPVSHLNPTKGAHRAPLGSVGFTLPNVESKLIDLETGEDIAVPDEGVSAPGELLCRGPNIMQGYLGNAEATAETLDADGFLHTGDVATVSSEGYVTIVDRVKELIKYKGYQVAPAELEALLLEHPDVADAAVIAGTNDEGNEIPKAFVVIREGATVTDDDLSAFVADRVAPHKKVRQFERIAQIPKSASGKILRKDLRDRPAS